jgi:hypothetical protein
MMFTHFLRSIDQRAVRTGIAQVEVALLVVERAMAGRDELIRRNGQVIR